MGSMGGGGGDGGGDSRQTVINEPWSVQQPYLKRGFAQAETNLFAGGPRYFPGHNVIAESPQTIAARNNTWDRATNGSPVMGAAGNMTLDTLNGKYLSPDSNPYLKATYDQALQSALPSLNATFSAAGRTGADAQTQGLADTYGALGRDIYGQNYQQERARQMQALIFAPQIAANDYQDLQAQQGVGAARDARSQNVLNANMERYNFAQNRPYDNLARYMQTIQGQYGGTQNTTGKQPSYSNPMGSALGGAMTGYSAFGPLGGIGGGLLGLLGG